MLTAEDAFRLWEAGWGLTPLRRAVALAAAATGTAPDDVARRPVGERDRALYALRERMFGPVLDAVARCPRCATEVELRFDQRDLLADVPAPQPEVTVATAGGPRRFRTPCSDDVAAVAGLAPERAERELLRRCGSGGSGEPAADAAVVARAWTAADPLADVTVGLCCPDCSAGWDEPVDIVAFFWGELDGWCRATLVEVHQLARAYGWSEADVLRLSPWRRQCYLGLVSA